MGTAWTARCRLLRGEGPGCEDAAGPEFASCCSAALGRRADPSESHCSLLSGRAMGTERCSSSDAVVAQGSVAELEPGRRGPKDCAGYLGYLGQEKAWDSTHHTQLLLS